MHQIVGLVSNLPSSKEKKDDSFCDRLNSKYTVVILVVFAIIVTAQMVVGNAITCWMPNHFTGSHGAYATSYCWVKNTYYLPYEEEIPKPHEHDKRQMIPYYQWIPFILLAQAALFYAPSVVWHGLNQKGGIDADNILQASHGLTLTSQTNMRETMLTLITNQMHRFLRCKKAKPQGIRGLLNSLCGSRIGSYLVLLFLWSKVLYIANIIFQLFMLNTVLATKYNVYGFEVMKGLWRDHEWIETPGVAFPRVTMCDFNVRRLGNVHRYAVQCALPMNLYNEKIYIFLWFWMVILAVITSLDFVVWLVRYCLRSDKVQFINNKLQLVRSKEGLDLAEVDDFVDNYLRQDGVFLLRLIVHNTNSATCRDITTSLFRKWQEDHPSPPVDRYAMSEKDMTQMSTLDEKTALKEREAAGNY